MNDDTELKTLMIHVERIVRPVRATANRKLRMRRELLAHLQSALEEERPKGGTDSELLTRAHSRLGDPAQLTQQLQLTVPRIERFFLAKLPVPKSLDRWEQRSEKQWVFLTTIQSVALSGFSLLLLFLFIGIYGVPAPRLSSFLNMQTEAPLHYNLICLAGGILLTSLPLLVISLIGNVVQFGWRSRPVFILAIAIIIVELLWVLLFNSQISGRPITPLSILFTLLTSTLFVGLQIGIAHSVKRMGNHCLEWKQLNIAE